MKCNEFYKQYPYLNELLEDCFNSEKGTRVKYQNYVFVTIGNEKVIFGNLKTLPDSLPEILTKGF